MKDKFPEIYKNKVEKIKSKVQNEFYYHANENKNDHISSTIDNNVSLKADKMALINKIENIFKRPDYVYQADVIIMRKDGKNINKKLIGFKDNYLLTLDGEKLYLDDIYDIK